MYIKSVVSMKFEEDNLAYVTAIVEDSILLYPQTLEDPAEYGPGLCEATFELCEDDVIPDNDSELIQFLENLDLEWQLVDDSDNDLDFYFP